MHAITGQQVEPGHSYLLQQQSFGASTCRSGGTSSPTVPLEAETQGSGLGFLPQLGERCRVCGGAAASQGLALLEGLQWHCCPLPTPTSLTWAQTRYVWNLLEALQARATSHTGVCFETNTHYRAAFTSNGSECSKATKCHRPDSEKCRRTSPDWEGYQQQRIQNFTAITEN